MPFGWCWRIGGSAAGDWAAIRSIAAQSPAALMGASGETGSGLRPGLSTDQLAELRSCDRGHPGGRYLSRTTDGSDVTTPKLLLPAIATIWLGASGAWPQ